MRADDLLLDLDPAQRAAVTEPVVPLAILAPAGSGKTRALTRRIAWQAATGNLDPNHVLAVTFTRKAAGELRGRLARLGVRGAVTAGHVPRGRARPAPPPARGRRHRDAGPPRSQGSPARADARPGQGRGAGGRDQRGRGRDRVGQGPAHRARRLRRAGASGRAVDAPPPRPRSPNLYAGYEREKKRKGLLDFDDLIGACTEALEQDPAFAATQRWRFRHLFVDEFQDVTRSQLDLAARLARRRARTCASSATRTRRSTAFAGADSELLTRFPDRFDGAAVVRLDANYRSTPEIVAAARAVLPERRAGRGPRRGPRGPATLPSPRTTSDAHEARERRRGAPARARADATVVEHGRALPGERPVGPVRGGAARASGIPYRVRGAARFLDRPEVKVVIDELRTAGKTAPGRAFAEHLTDLVADARDLSEDRREHVDAVAALGREYLAAEGSTGSVDRIPRVPAGVAARGRRRRAAGRRGRPAHLPPGQGPRVGHRVRHRPRARARADLARDGSPRRARRGAPPALRRARAGPSGGCTSRGRRSGPAATRVVTADEEPVPHRGRARVADARARAVRAGDAGAGPAGARRLLAALEHGEIAMPGPAAVRRRSSRWRQDLARAAAVPAYVILDNKTLRQRGDRPAPLVGRAARAAGHRAGQARAVRRRAARGGRPAPRLTGDRSGRTMQGRTGCGPARRRPCPCTCDRRSRSSRPTRAGRTRTADGAAEAELLRQGYIVEHDVDLDALQLVANSTRSTG